MVTGGATGGVGIPLMDMFAKLGSTGGGGIPASTAGSGMTMFSGGIVKRGVVAFAVVVPNSGVSWPSSANAGGT